MNENVIFALKRYKNIATIKLMAFRLNATKTVLKAVIGILVFMVS